MATPDPSLERSTRHQRRIRVMLWFGSAVLIIMGALWLVFFALQGNASVAAVDAAMIFAGVMVGALNHLRRTRVAFYLFFATSFLVVCGISWVLDVPSPAAPRSTHLFLLVLALAGALFLRDEPKFLRFGVVGICFVTFVVLAATNMAMQSPFAIPDSVRIPGTWVNTTGAIIAMYVLMHVTVSDLAEVSSMELDLRKGIARSEFFLLYQPQVTSTGQVIGAEALVRWQHPKRGLVGPMEFIGLAEQSGLIVPLGLWVLSQACAQLVEWSKNPLTAQLTVSVNVSAHQIQQANFVQQVHAVLQRFGIRPECLKLELTESMLVEDMDDILQKMTALQSLGVGISLDDFGTGYSSLSYLKRLPLDMLKIDQSFVRDVLTDESDASIARTIIQLGKSLKFAVIAEGVETEGQRDFLMQNDCHLFQGYLFSKPITAPQLVQYIAQNTA